MFNLNSESVEVSIEPGKSENLHGINTQLNDWLRIKVLGVVDKEEGGVISLSKEDWQKICLIILSISVKAPTTTMVGAEAPDWLIEIIAIY